MNLKEIRFPIEIKSVNHARSYILQKAYTNDLNSIKIIFELLDCTPEDLTGATASIMLYMRDGSFFQDTATITGNTVTYTLTEAQGNHAGVAQAQVIVKKTGTEWASSKEKFEIVSGLETAVATEVMIKDWTTLTAEARAFIDDAEAAEALRVSAEAARVNDFSSKADKTYVDAQLAETEQKVLYQNLSYFDFPFKLGEYITSGGIVQIGTTLALSGFIPVENGELYYFKEPSDATISNLFVGAYNSSKTFISRIDVLGGSIKITTDIKFIRIMIGRNSSTGIPITQDDVKNNLSVSVFADHERYTEALRKIDKLSVWKSAIEKNVDIETIAMQEGKYVNLATTSVSLTPMEAGTTPQSCAIVPCLAGDKFVVSAVGGTSSHAVGFIRADGSKIYSEGQSSAIVNKQYIAPDNSAYLIINDTSGAISYKVKKKSLFDVVIEAKDYTKQHCDIRADKKWYANGGYSIMIYIGDCPEISIQGNSTQSSIVALLKTDQAVTGSIADFATGFDGRQTIAVGATWRRSIPSDAKYMYVLVSGSDGTDCAPISITLTASAQHISDSSKPNKYDIGSCYDNIKKKTSQYKDVRWMALSSVPKVSGSFSAGPVLGVPYSSVKECNKFIGFEVSMRTFMTAARNPYSLLYTENVSGASSQSGYGKTYHGVNCGAYFGTVCNTFSLASLGFGIPWNSTEFEYLAKINILTKKADQTGRGIEVGDLIHEPGHVNVITAVKRDSNGVPVAIEWTETSSVLPYANIYTKAQFDNRIVTRNGTVYGYNRLYENSIYSPSEFVAVGTEEVPAPYNYNDDVCTFAGDYASFRTGEDIWINYNLGETVYTEMSVYNSSGVAVETVQLNVSEHKVKLSALGYGSYTAVLRNVNEVSDPTYFEVIETTVDATLNGTSVNVEFESRNGSPLYFQICYISGTSVGIKPLTDDEKTYGTFNFDYDKLHKAEYGIPTFLEDVYLKVFFKGRYGTVTNQPIKLTQ